MNKLLRNAMAAMMILASSATFISCDKDFDNPPMYEEPDITPNITIAALKARHTAGQVETITDDIIVAGVVNADDRSGNYYKQLSFQDSTGGITIRLDGNNLFNNYPVGRRIYVKLKGLVLNDYNGLIQIATGATAAAIPSTLFDQYIVKGGLGYVVTPKIVTVADLNPSLQSMLIQINNAEFVVGDTAKTYADVAGNLTVNLNIRPCGATSNTIVRTSGYANFAGINVPNGNGTLKAIYTTFGATKQLIIRDTSDVQFTGNRCDGSSGGGGTTPPTGTLTTIAQLRAMYTGTGIKITSALKIGGVVISDATNKNATNGAAVIQDGDAAIIVYFGGTLTYNIGDSIVLDIQNDSLINYRNSLELKTAIGTTAPAPVATGKVITPKVKTIAEVNTMLGMALNAAGNFENTLIKIVNATATPAGTYAGSKTLTDASGTITLFTQNAATFSGTTMPTTAKSWTGYAYNFSSTKEFQIRNLSDVQ